MYGSVSGADTYHAARGNAAWAAGSADDRLAALVRGSTSLDAVYGDRYIGTQAAFPQDDAWPRTDAEWPDGTTVSGIPDQVVWSAYEYALMELVSPGSTTPTVTPGKVKRRARVEGAVDVSYWFPQQSDDMVDAMTPLNLTVEGYLRDLTGGRVSLPGILIV